MAICCRKAQLIPYDRFGGLVVCQDKGLPMYSALQTTNNILNVNSENLLLVKKARTAAMR